MLPTRRHGGFPNGSAQVADSIEREPEFFPEAVGRDNRALHRGSAIVNGTVGDESNPSGAEPPARLKGCGCKGGVEFNEAVGEITTVLCPGGS